MLEDQFGRRQTLADFQGESVLLTFVDSRCTTVCPLTAALMRRTQDLLPQGTLQLIAVNANPDHTLIGDVRRWSEQHRMNNRWLFLTAPARRLRVVWKEYGIEVDVAHHDVNHTALIYVIDPSGGVQSVVPISSRRGLAAEARALARLARQASSSVS